MILELPYPPSVNTYWRANGKRRFISKEGVLFKTAVQAICFRDKVGSFGDARLSVNIYIHPRSRSLFDADFFAQSSTVNWVLPAWVIDELLPQLT